MPVDTLVVQPVGAFAKSARTRLVQHRRYYLTEAGLEVDFVVERGAEVVALEIEASRNVSAADLRGFKTFTPSPSASPSPPRPSG